MSIIDDRVDFYKELALDLERLPYVKRVGYRVGAEKNGSQYVLYNEFSLSVTQKKTFWSYKNDVSIQEIADYLRVDKGLEGVIPKKGLVTFHPMIKPKKFKPNEVQYEQVFNDAFQLNGESYESLKEIINVRTDNVFSTLPPHLFHKNGKPENLKKLRDIIRDSQ